MPVPVQVLLRILFHIGGSKVSRERSPSNAAAIAKCHRSSTRVQKSQNEQSGRGDHFILLPFVWQRVHGEVQFDGRSVGRSVVALNSTCNLNLQKHLDINHTVEEKATIPTEGIIKCRACDAIFYNYKAYNVHNIHHKPDDLYVTSEEQRYVAIIRFVYCLADVVRLYRQINFPNFVLVADKKWSIVSTRISTSAEYLHYPQMFYQFRSRFWFTN